VRAACFGVAGAIICVVLASPAGPHISVPGKVAAIAAIVNLVALVCIGMARTTVQVYAGKVDVIRGWRTRTIRIGDIREITLDTKSNCAQNFWVPRIQLASGGGLWLDSLSCGSALRPPAPWRLASFDTFQALIGTNQAPAPAGYAPDAGDGALDGDGPVAPGPAPADADAAGDCPRAWTEGRQMLPPAGFYLLAVPLLVLAWTLDSQLASARPLVYVCQARQDGRPPACVNDNELMVSDRNGAPIFAVAEAGGAKVFGDNLSVNGTNVFSPNVTISWESPVAYTGQQACATPAGGRIWIDSGGAGGSGELWSCVGGRWTHSRL
jgi:hypothetical protein